MDEQDIEKRKNWVLTKPKPTLARCILKSLGLAYDEQDIVIETDRQSAEIISVLTSKVVFYSWWGLGLGSQGKYTGRVTDQNFKIKWEFNRSPIILYGSIKQTTTGSKISAYLEIDPLMRLYAIAFYGSVAIMLYQLLRLHFPLGSEQTVNAFFILTLVLLGTLAWKSMIDAIPRSTARKKLLDLLEQVTTYD